MSTLKLTIELEPAPRLLLIGSAGGMRLVEDNLKVLGLTRIDLILPPPYDKYLRGFRHRRLGHTILVFGWQLFTNIFPRRPPQGFKWEDLATQLRPMATPPY